MTICRISDADKAALKAAARRMIKVAGGLESASTACRASKTSLGRFGSIHDEQFIPADVIADLEADVGEPIVSRELARLAGYELTPARLIVSAAADPASMVINIARAAGELAAAVQDMDADGRREVRELKAVVDALSSLVRTGNHSLDGVQRMILAAKHAAADEAA